ncbi:MAG: hypothetical protein QOD83_3499 [Solirubrobacteraceae bacterium]|nr:hypothetical protein [Solirubrobacteraceae bacterium]
MFDSARALSTHARKCLAWWKPRRLTLAGLPLPTQIVACAALTAWALAALVLVMLALKVALPGGADNVATRATQPDMVARAVILLGYSGLACACAALVVAAADPQARWGRATLAAIGLLGAGLGGSLVQLSGLVSTYNHLVEGKELFADGAAALVMFLGVVAMSVAVATAFAPRSWLRRSPALAATAGATPFICGLMGYVWLLVAARDQVAGLPHPYALAAQSLVALVAGAGFVVGSLLVWQAVVGAHASREIGLGLGRVARRWPSLLLFLLSFKVVWLFLGYIDELPPALGGNLDSWPATRHDDWLSWLIVSVLAIAWGYSSSDTSGSGLSRRANSLSPRA